MLPPTESPEPGYIACPTLLVPNLAFGTHQRPLAPTTIDKPTHGICHEHTTTVGAHHGVVHDIGRSFVLDETLHFLWGAHYAQYDQPA